MPQVVQDLAPYLNSYGYLAVLGAILLEDFGGTDAGEDYADRRLSIRRPGPPQHCLGLDTGVYRRGPRDNIGFAIGHFGGRRVALRFGRYVFLTEKRLAQAESFFDWHGGKVVTVARFIEGFRQLNGIVAGTSGMEWRRFLAFNALGALLWVGFWGSVGYFFGDRLAGILSVFKRFEVYFVIGLGAILIFLLIRYLIRRLSGEESMGGRI